MCILVLPFQNHTQKMNSIEENLKQLQKKAPLVHNITNYVVMNSTANALLAIGASPVMAHAIEEVEEITSISSALVLNIGTLSNDWIKAMISAGKKAKSLGIPIVFDPVGAGASKLRNDTCAQIIAECTPDIIRGNASEIMALKDASISTKGVDSTKSSTDAIHIAKQLATSLENIIVISGATDYITNGKKVISIENGSPLMGKVTGMGCTASAVIGAFTGCNRDYLNATANAMAIMGIAGEIAEKNSKGPGSFQMNFIDALYTINSKAIQSKMKITSNED